MTASIASTPSTESARTARHVLSVILRDPLSLIGTLIIILVLFMAIFAEQAAPYPEEGKGKTNAPNTLMTPSADHWFGTDKLGRDILSRIIMGSRSALIVPIGVVLFAVLLGAPLGALAGYKGGWLDEVIMRVTDLFLAFPSLLLAMAIASALGRGLDKAAIALIVSWWPWYTRIARGVAVGLRERYFVEAAQAIGVSDAVIIFRHILPNTISPILVQATVDMGTVIRLGLDGQRRQDVHSRSMVERNLPRHGDLYRCAGIQFAGRYPA